jgi:hypothetical protein
MYMPEITARFEICQTDAESLKEWRVALGGAVRGGMSVNHGYMPTQGPLMEEAIREILSTIRTLLEAYAVGLGGLQGVLFEQ